MNIIKDIKPVTYLKNSTAELLRELHQNRRPVIITQNGTASAVIQDPESYDNMRNTIALLKLLNAGEKNISEGNMKNQSDVFRSIRNSISEYK